MPRRKRRVLQPAARREELLDAAVKVFSQKGYRRASISDIIASAGVARGTFYLYFESKEQVFRVIVNTFHTRIRQRLELASELPHIGTDARASIARAFDDWIEFFAEHRAAARIVLRDAAAIDARFEKGYTNLRRSAISHLTRRVQHLQDLGLVRTGVRPELVALAQLGMLDEAVRSLVLDDPPPDETLLVETLVDVHWIGLRPD